MKVYLFDKEPLVSSKMEASGLRSIPLVTMVLVFKGRPEVRKEEGENDWKLNGWSYTRSLFETRSHLFQAKWKPQG